MAIGFRRLFVSRLRNHFRQASLRIKRKVTNGKSDQGIGFFDRYPRFYETSTTAPVPNRLNKRYRALIEANKAIISGKSVLDLASHDGRWSFAAYKAGARFVLGIEAREYLVKNARDNLLVYDVPERQVQFIAGDVFETFDQLEPNRFDTVFCFGFLYHTMHHMLVLNEIARLRSTHLILDTAIDLDPDPVVFLRSEDVTHEAFGAVPDPGDREHILTGVPTKSALELMLSHSGFPLITYFDWHQAGVKQWDDLVDYHKGQRVSLVATRKST